MNLEFSPEQLAVRELARRFAREKLAPVAAQLSRDGVFPVELVRELARLGLMGINVPRRYGGMEAGPVAGVLAGMELAYHDAAFTVAYSVSNMVAEVIARFGTEAQRQKFLPRITSGEAVCGAFALSETSSASDAASLQTRAERRGDTFVINGSKQWISHGSYAGVVVVWARSLAKIRGAHGVSAFIVEGGTPGMQAGPPEEKMGLRSSKTVALHFEDCVVPAENLLGREGEGFKLAMIALDGGRINIGSQACGVARAACDAAVRFLKGPANFESPEARSEQAANLLADPATELAAAELMTLRAAWLKEQGRPFIREASMAKVFASEMAQRACERALQVHGYAGAFDEFPVERYFRDARVQTIYEGTSEIQRLVIARDLLKD